MKRHRSKCRDTEKNNHMITLTDEAWGILRRVAESASLSISEFIEQWARNQLAIKANTRTQAFSIIAKQIEHGNQETVVINETITKDDGEKIVVTSKTREVKKIKPPSDSLLKFIIGSEPIDRQINWLLNEEIIDDKQAERLSIMIEEFRRATIAIVKGES
ncbi:hypothetical protein [Kamptonema sp. UHCC 0994]|uniref:hypothetical protein n=1 Tax=Kamptonema sp. UHCC 0994 TaxID=3031329 RepID=UPI0023B9154B|nr:hypothetical protein [Kamptonema sp. UHCC 0994]MDF0553133.1 hypothetical protein [Kamptonema sp. UHCC 0994]